jgi:hypothetical protein
MLKYNPRLALKPGGRLPAAEMANLKLLNNAERITLARFELLKLLLVGYTF